MSLVNFAVRQCLKKALLHRTLAEGRVFDSMVVPIDETPQEGAKPQIIVATDDDQVTCSSWDLNVDGRDLDVIIEMELATEVEMQSGGLGFEIPLTDAGLEAILDFMHRQVLRAIAEPADPWADLFRRFCGTPSKMLKRRGASNEKGVKFATRQIVLTCTPSNEPVYGQAPNKLWTAFIEQMEADPDLSEYGGVVAALITGASLPSWRALQAALGFTDAEIRNLGPAPLDPTETGEPPVMTEATLDEVLGDGSVARTLTITEADRAEFEAGS